MKLFQVLLFDAINFIQVPIVSKLSVFEGWKIKCSEISRYQKHPYPLKWFQVYLMVIYFNLSQRLALTSTTSLGQFETGSNCEEGVLHIPQNSGIAKFLGKYFNRKKQFHERKQKELFSLWKFCSKLEKNFSYFERVLNLLKQFGSLSH